MRLNYYTKSAGTGALKIVLISPKGPLYRHRSGIFKKRLRAAPLTLTTLAALVPSELNAFVEIYDEGIEELPELLSADLIGMTVITGSAPRSYELCREFRTRGLPVVLGGPHVTLMPEEAALHADAIVVGYAEESWPRLLREFVRGELKKRYCMRDDFTLSCPEYLPSPRRELLKKRSYATIYTFEATRACVHSCEFCVVPSAWGTKLFQKPVAHVIDDIVRSGAKRIVFYDLNLFADFSYVRELLTAMVPLKVRWFGLSTVMLGKDPALMELTRRSGCAGLLIGFETVSPRGLVQYGKEFSDPAAYGAFVQSLHELGIIINGTFVFGSDADDASTFDETKDFVLTHHIELPRFAVLTPFPGTPLFCRLEQEGRIRTTDWSLYDGQHVVFAPAKMTEEELRCGYQKIWEEVYSYRSIWQRTKQAARNFPLVAGANFAYRYYAHNLHRSYTCTGGLA